MTKAKKSNLPKKAKEKTVYLSLFFDGEYWCSDISEDKNDFYQGDGIDYILEITLPDPVKEKYKIIKVTV